MNTDTQSANVVEISQAKSFVPAGDRYVDIHAFMHHFSVSRAAAKNYAAGFYYAKGEKVYYPKGPMPHTKTPGGYLRFKLSECEEWLAAE